MTRKPDDWMPLDVRKYLGDTMHLGREQHGAYLLLLMAYWMRGGPLGDSDPELAAIVRASLPDWKRLRPVLAQFFQIADGKWVQKRAEEELARARSFIDKKSEAGKKGAENRWRTNGEPNSKPMAVPLADVVTEWVANVCVADAPVPSTSTSREGRKSISLAADAAFAEFWVVCPRKVGRGKAQSLFKSALKEVSAAVLIAAMARYAESQADTEKKFIAHPTTWLGQKRWLDEDSTVVIRPTAFQSPEEIEGQRLARERAYGQTGN